MIANILIYIFTFYYSKFLIKNNFYRIIYALSNTVGIELLTAIVPIINIKQIFLASIMFAVSADIYKKVSKL